MTDPIKAMDLSVPCVFELAEHAVIDLSGPDAQSWLQGQTTQDVSPLRAGQSAYSLFVTPQGRVFCDAWICASQNVWKLIVKKSIRAALFERLQRYIVMEDVNCALSDECVIHLVGPGSENLLAEHRSSAWPTQRLGQQGFDLLIDATEREKTLATLIARCKEHGGHELSKEERSAQRIAHGIAEFLVDFGEENFPQEAGLGASAVSFTKGCYLGQEPVAMLEHRGKIKKQLVLLRASKLANLSAKSEIQTSEGTRVGFITSVSRMPSDDYALALGYVQTTSIDTNALLRAGSEDLKIEKIL